MLCCARTGHTVARGGVTATDGWTTSRTGPSKGSRPCPPHPSRPRAGSAPLRGSVARPGRVSATTVLTAPPCPRPDDHLAHRVDLLTGHRRQLQHRGDDRRALRLRQPARPALPGGPVSRRGFVEGVGVAAAARPATNRHLSADSPLRTHSGRTTPAPAPGPAAPRPTTSLRKSIISWQATTPRTIRDSDTAQHTTSSTVLHQDDSAPGARRTARTSVRAEACTDHRPTHHSRKRGQNQSRNARKVFAVVNTKHGLADPASVERADGARTQRSRGTGDRPPAGCRPLSGTQTWAVERKPHDHPDQQRSRPKAYRSSR